MQDEFLRRVSSSSSAEPASPGVAGGQSCLSLVAPIASRYLKSSFEGNGSTRQGDDEWDEGEMQ